MGIPKASLAWILLLAEAIAASAAGATAGKPDPRKLRLVGTFSIAATSGPSAAAAPGLEVREGPDVDRNFDKQISGTISPARVPSSHVPRPFSSLITGPISPPLLINGITHAEQRLAGTGSYFDTQFSTEPPDQALAVGNGFIMEAVNTAIRIRSAMNGAALGAVVPLNQFFKLAPEIIRTTPPVYGPFLADPRAYWDAATGRFFVTVLKLGVVPATGDFDGTSSVLIAVSTSGAPTNFFLYDLSTTNGNGTRPNHPGCPCFGDQPLIGADANGFYISTNEFSIFGSGINGAQVYAISKADLISGALSHPVVVFDGLRLAEGVAYSLQPATVPPGGTYASGTEYFLSALDFNATLDNRIALWEVAGTASLNTAAPGLTLTSKVIDSQIYGQPPDMQQRDGPLALADLIFSGALTGKKIREHLPLVAANDDRMQQTVYAGGQLWSALNTVVKPDNGPVRTGIAWFIVRPSGTGSSLNGAIVKQGYVSANRNNVAFPSIGVNSTGKGIMTFSLIGEDYFPSAAYVPIDFLTGTGPVRIAASGVAPEDGFTGYGAFGGRVARWGDYSAAVADSTGAIWIATEYIPALPRTTLANWGTAIAKVNPLAP